jgi:GT2 family glycosyltransferase
VPKLSVIIPITEQLDLENFCARQPWRQVNAKTEVIMAYFEELDLSACASELQAVKKVSTPKRQGSNYLKQEAISQAKGDFFALINPDLELDSVRLGQLVTFLENQPQALMVGPRIIYADGSTEDSFRRFPNIIDLAIKRVGFLRRRLEKRVAKFLMWDVDFTHPLKVDWLCDAAIVAQKKLWQDLGGLDLRYKEYMADTDICRTAWKKGFEVWFEPRVELRYFTKTEEEAKSLGAFFRQAKVRAHTFSALKYFFKWLFARG